MARPYRLQGENLLYHITSRGDDRKRIYVKPADYLKFLKYTAEAKERYHFYLYAYCLMSNHFHLLLETTKANISQIMHYIKGSYTTYYNIRHGRIGHLFQGRYKSIVVDKDSYLLELSRYIHLNPVRDGIVNDPKAYRWSSYKGFLGKSNPYLDTDQLKQYIGMNRGQYRRFVLEVIAKDKNPFLDVYAGFLLGSASFIKSKLQELELQITGDDVAYAKKLNDDAARIEDIITSVTSYYLITLDELKQSKIRPTIARQILVYLLRQYTGLTNRNIGRIVGLRPQAVSKAGMTIKRLIERDSVAKKTVKEIVSTFEG